MPSEDLSLARLMTQIFEVLESIRISRDISRDEGIKGKTGVSQIKFIEGVGESVYDTFLRVIGLLKLSPGENAQISSERKIVVGENIVDSIFRSKDENTIALKQRLAVYLQALGERVQNFTRDKNLTKVRRIRKLIGKSTKSPRKQILQTPIDLTDDVRENLNLLREKLQALERNQDKIGIVTKELKILKTFISDTNNLLAILSTSKLAQGGSILTSLVRENTKGFEAQLERATRRYEALNNELLLAEHQQRLVNVGASSITGEKLSLKNVLATMLFLINDVGYVCKECRFFAKQQAVAASDEGSKDTMQCIDSQQQNDTKGTTVTKGICTRFEKQGTKRPTNEKASCNCVWADTSQSFTNPYWEASTAVVEKARELLVIKE